MKVKYLIEEGNSQIAVRIPGWSKNFKALLNGNDISFENLLKIEKGYAYISVKKSDVLEFDFESSPYFVYPNPKIPDLSGQVAVCRGPLVYCAEGVDNQGDVLSLSLDTKAVPKIENFDEKLLGGTVRLTAKGYRQTENDELYSLQSPKMEMANIRMVPYYTWGNRGENQMKIWFPKV